MRTQSARRIRKGRLATISQDATKIGSPPPETEVRVQVAVALPLRQTFTYRVPHELRDGIVVGGRVQVPFGRRRLAGFVVAEAPAHEPPPAGLRDVLAIIDREPVLPAELLALLRKAADYYFHPLGEVLESALPPGAHAASEPHLRLTDAGRAALEQGELDDVEAQLLALLAPAPRPEPAVLARLSGLTPNRLNTLRRRGWLERIDVVAEPDLGPLLEAFVVWLADAAPGDRLGLRQRQLLDRVRERGEVAMDELRQVHREARTVVMGLARKGLVRIEEREVAADPLLAGAVPADSAVEPNADQRAAIETILGSLGSGYRGFLLHGVTGSGKTEVYLRVLEQVRSGGGGAIVLVPEIALTPQLVGRFRARLGNNIAVLHSALRDRDRFSAWKALRDGRVRVAVGTRSALFAPVASLKLLIVDEEHDSSFKQEEGFRYHARDLALLRASQAGAIAVLGSATPSLESFQNSATGKLVRLDLPNRATPHSLPAVQIVNLSNHHRGPTGSSLLSGPLFRAIEETLAAGEQGILFLNRRGFAPAVLCEGCGEALRCPACSVGLVHHRRISMLRCHFCDFARDVPEHCEHCGDGALTSLGIGTEQVEALVREAFPTARIARLDRDTASARGIEAVLDRLRSRQLDLLVGTQMVAKGHDFPGVTLVGVVLADHTLSLPDFRASERAFQLLAQVAGRAGRGEKQGRVLIQTYMPDHFAVRAAAAHDYRAFFHQEHGARRELGYPPFGRLVAVRVDAPSEPNARTAAESLAAVGRRASRGTGVIVSGPAPAPVARIRARYRFRIFVRGAEIRALRAAVAAIARVAGDVPNGVRVGIDVDPVSML